MSQTILTIVVWLLGGKSLSEKVDFADEKHILSKKISDDFTEKKHKKNVTY